MTNINSLTDVADLDPETQAIALKAIGLREQNAIMSGKIEQLGGAVDVAAARQEHMLVSLVAMGIITERQMWEINADWEANLRPQLKQSFEQINHIHQRQQEQVRQAHIEASRPKLIVPNRG